MQNVEVEQELRFFLFVVQNGHFFNNWKTLVTCTVIILLIIDVGQYLSHALVKERLYFQCITSEIF